MFICPPLSLPTEFSKLKTDDNKLINFYSLYPIYKEEMDYKHNEGADALIDKFQQFNVTDVVDIDRVNTCI